MRMRMKRNYLIYFQTDSLENSFEFSLKQNKNWNSGKHWDSPRKCLMIFLRFKFWSWDYFKNEIRKKWLNNQSWWLNSWSLKNDVEEIIVVVGMRRSFTKLLFSKTWFAKPDCSGADYPWNDEVFRNIFMLGV